MVATVKGLKNAGQAATYFGHDPRQARPEQADYYTEREGRYVLPDLPKANYTVWVRGYGLVDSPKVKAVPGKNLNLAPCRFG